MEKSAWHLVVPACHEDNNRDPNNPPDTSPLPAYRSPCRLRDRLEVAVQNKQLLTIMAIICQLTKGGNPSFGEMVPALYWTCMRLIKLTPLAMLAQFPFMLIPGTV